MNNKQLTLHSAFSTLLFTLTFVALLFCSTNANSNNSENNIENLILNNKLVIDLRVSKQNDIIVQEQVVLSIDVATDRWFAKGIAIKEFNIPEMVVLPLTGQAINGTKKVDYQTWATQTREIIAYPTKSGLYSIPPIAVDISVNTENGIVSGTAYTSSLELNVGIPETLADKQDYIVSNQVNVEVTYENFTDTIDTEETESIEEHIYKIGSAVTQNIVITAENVPAMMYPQLIQPNIEGISIYRKPSLITDKNIRGVMSGTMVESFSFIFEKAGVYQLPERSILWFNTKTMVLEEIIIPSQKWRVSNAVLQNKPGSRMLNLTTLTSNTLLKILVCLVFVIFVLLLFIKRQALARFYKRVTQQERRIQSKCYLDAIQEGDYKCACQCLYNLVAIYQEKRQLRLSLLEYNVLEYRLKPFYANSPEQGLLLNRLLSLAYGEQSIKFTLIDAKKLLKFDSINKEMQRLFHHHNDLKLNP
jgi:hypothetical protein